MFFVVQVVSVLTLQASLKYPLRFEICTREICEKFVYKHSETIDMLKINLLFKKFTNLRGK